MSFLTGYNRVIGPLECGDLENGFCPPMPRSIDYKVAYIEENIGLDFDEFVYHPTVIDPDGVDVSGYHGECISFIEFQKELEDCYDDLTPDEYL